MNRARAVLRLVRVLWHALRGAAICGLLFPFRGPAARMRHVGVWSATMLRVLGIGMTVSGVRHPSPVLLVANHVSWLDILAINAVAPVRFVSKADVRRWPLLGWMVACGGTLFIERERKRDALRVVHQLAESLRAGDAVAIFPEGTTSDGHGLLPFHANLLQAAIATGTPVQPVALRYRDAGSTVSAAAAYVGDMSLAQSVWAVACADRLTVGVSLLPARDAAALPRRVLGDRLSDDIGAALDGHGRSPEAG